MVYRQAAPHTAAPHRVHVLTLRRRGVGWRITTGALVLACFVAAAALGRTGSTLTCTRARAGAVPRCLAADRQGTDDAEQSFDGVAGAVTWQSVDQGDDGSSLELTMGSLFMHGSATNEGAARAFVSAYEAFVADGRALHFERTIGPPLWMMWPGAALLSLLFVLTLRQVDETTRVTLDLDDDRLTVATSRWLEKAPRTTVLDWTRLSSVEARSPKSEEEGVEQLVGVSAAEKTPLPLCVVRDDQARPAAAQLVAWMRAERERREELARA